MKDKITGAAAVLLILSIVLVFTGCGTVSDSTVDIGQDQALSTALNHAGVAANEAEVTKSAKSNDDGRITYEFHFRTDDAEYEYEIHASTAEVIEFSKEVFDRKSASSTEGTLSDGSPASDSQASAGSQNPGSSRSTGTDASSEYIGADKARSIALEDAGLKVADATFTAAKLDRDDGRYVYEIDFYTADKEYDYEIDAISGKILDRDSEPLDDWDDDWDD